PGMVVALRSFCRWTRSRTFSHPPNAACFSGRLTKLNATWQRVTGSSTPKSRRSSGSGPVKARRLIRWSRLAEHDLEAAHAYLAERTPGAAQLLPDSPAPGTSPPHLRSHCLCVTPPTLAAPVLGSDGHAFPAQ